MDIRINHHVYLHSDGQAHQQIVALLNQVISQGVKIMGDTSKLVAGVAQIKADADAVKAGVDALLAAQASGDQAAIDQAVADLSTAHDSLQATIAETVPPNPPL